MRFLPVNASYAALPVNASDPIIHFPPHTTQQYSIGWKMAAPQQNWANNDGYYSDYDYVRNGKPTMAVIGDSFVQASQVPNAEAFHALLHNALQGQGNVYGFGVQGAPLSQYLLFAQYARERYQPEAMVFTIISNDFDQSIHQYGSTLLSGMHLFSDTSPQARLELLEYEGGDRPGLRGLLKRSALLRYLYDNVGLNPGQLKAWFAPKPDQSNTALFGGAPANVEPERLMAAQRAVDLFFQHLPEKSGLTADKIVFVLDGMREVKDTATGDIAEQSYFGQMRRYFTQAAQQGGYTVVDMHPIFYQAQQNGEKVDFIPIDWHWNSFGHALVADAIKQTTVYQRTFTPQPPQ